VSDAVKEYCLREYFVASCPSIGHVILMTSALYGRMRIGRCIRGTFNIGCSNDVTALFDDRCSGHLVSVVSEVSGSSVTEWTAVSVGRQVFRATGQWVIGGQWLAWWSLVVNGQRGQWSVGQWSVGQWSLSGHGQCSTTGVPVAGQWVTGGQWSLWSVVSGQWVSGQWSLSGQRSMFDDRCSGRTSCNVSVRSLVDSRPCQRDFASYLEASYRCVRGTLPGHFNSSGDDVDLNTIPLDFDDSLPGHSDFTFISMGLAKFRCSHTGCGEDTVNSVGFRMSVST